MRFHPYTHTLSFFNELMGQSRSPPPSLRCPYSAPVQSPPGCLLVFCVPGESKRESMWLTKGVKQTGLNMSCITFIMLNVVLLCVKVCMVGVRPVRPFLLVLLLVVMYVGTFLVLANCWLKGWECQLHKVLGYIIGYIKSNENCICCQRQIGMEWFP